MILTVALTFAAPCFVLRLAAPAQAQSPLIQGWLASNTACRGGHADDPEDGEGVREARRARREAEAQALCLPGGRRLVEVPALAPVSIRQTLAVPTTAGA